MPAAFASPSMAARWNRWARRDKSFETFPCPRTVRDSPLEPASSLSESARPAIANELVAALRAPEAPHELRVFAARGLLPLEREDRMRALLAVLQDPDEE